jgi:hypothetical protein
VTVSDSMERLLQLMATMLVGISLQVRALKNVDLCPLRFRS